MPTDPNFGDFRYRAEGYEIVPSQPQFGLSLLLLGLIMFLQTFWKVF